MLIATEASDIKRCLIIEVLLYIYTRMRTDLKCSVKLKLASYVYLATVAK